MLFMSAVNGNHLAGSEISYMQLGNNRYSVIYTVYTDESSNAPGNQSVLEIRSTACNRYLTAVLNLDNSRTSIIGNTCASNSTGTLPAFKKWVYTGIVQLPTRCVDWKISVSDCCRSGLITSIERPDQTAIYTEALINNTLETSSPHFTADPEFYLPTGQEIHISNLAIAEQADSVVINSIAPRISGTGIVTYTSGYSPVSPLQLAHPIQLNKVTGEIVLQPIANETGILALTATSYKNGMLSGEVYREVRISALPTANRLPSLSGFDGTEKQSIDICAGSEMCFFLFASDDDAQDELTMEVLDSLPGATYLINGDGSLQCCWTPVADSTNDFILSVRLSDNHCPFAGKQVYTYQFHVNSLTAEVISTPVSCLGRTDGTAAVQYYGSSSSIYCEWLPTGQTGSQIDGLAAGNYSVVITDELGCQLEKSVVVSGNEAFAISSTSIKNATCSNTSDGEIILQLPSISNNYTYNWLPLGSTASHLENLTAGNYSVKVTDQLTGCTAEKNFTIAYDFNAPEISLGNTSSACIGRSIELTPGNGYSRYLWQDGSVNEQFSATNSGYYSVLVTDINGCQGESSIHLEFSACTAIEEPLSAASIRIYPNPVQSTLHVDFAQPLNNETSLTITDVLGHRIKSIYPENNTSSAAMSVAELPAGVYLLYIERSNEAAGYRFIKQ
jgi:hypothetical protein